MDKLKLNFQDTYLLYTTKTESYANADNTLDEWIRFLSYIKPENLEYLEKFNNKQIKNLTTCEIKKYLKIREQTELATLFIKYKNQDCKKDEYDKVVECMNKSLKSFMKESLSEAELKIADNIISELRNMTVSELDLFITKQIVDYDNLTILDAYILYIAREIRYDKKNDEVNNKIENDQLVRGNNLRRNLVRDFGLMR